MRGFYKALFLPNAMISMGKSVLHERFGAAQLSALSLSFRHLFPDCVGEFVMTHANVAVLCLAVILFVRYLRSPWRSVPPPRSTGPSYYRKCLRNTKQSLGVRRGLPAEIQ